MLQAIQEIPQEHLHTFQLFIHAIKKTSGHNNISLLGVCSYIYLLECLFQWVQSLSVIGQNVLQLLVNGVNLLVHWAAEHSKLVIRLT